MRLLQLVVASLLPVAALAARKTGEEKFREYRSQQQSRGLPLKLTDSSYSTLTGHPRNYSATILLTALEPKFGCQACHDFQPEWDLLSRTWVKGDKKGESKLVFGTLDFAEGKGTFQSLALVTAPVLLVFPPTEGPYAAADASPKRLDFSGPGMLSAESVHSWLARNMPGQLHPAFVRPVNYFRLAIVIVVALGIITGLVVASPYLLPLLQNRSLWAAVSLIAILLFTSGHMFNHIRKVPYIANDHNGKPSYFAGGFQNQFGLESQILAFIYGVLAFATISLALKVPRIADPKRQQVAVFVWGGVMLGAYSFLISVFKIKNGSYPFSLPPFF